MVDVQSISKLKQTYGEAIQWNFNMILDQYTPDL